MTRAIGHTNGYNSFEAQPPQGTETVGAGPNVQAQPVCRDSGNRRSRTRVHSPLPHTMARKRRAISIKGGKCRTSPRTRANFTVLDATIISSAPNNTNTNDHTNNAMEDLMNPHAVPAAANPAIPQRATCTISWQTYGRRSIFDIKIKFFIKTAIDLYLGRAVGCATKAHYQFDTDAHG